MIDQLLEAITHEAKCASTHSTPDNPSCSTTVTHLFRVACKRDGRLFCANAAQSAAAVLGDMDSYCDGCGDPIEDCWSVIPA